MAIFSKTKKMPVVITPEGPEPLKEIKIQATPEGGKRQLDIESLMLATGISTSVPGITNSYMDYDGQTIAIYAKYNGSEAFGNQLVRTVIDYRTAFIGGEGISVSCEDDAVADWIDDFLTVNKLNGSTLNNLVKGGEMAGQAIAVLEINKESGNVEVYRITWKEDKRYRAK